VLPEHHLLWFPILRDPKCLLERRWRSKPTTLGGSITHDTRVLFDALLSHLRSFLSDSDPQDDQTLMIIRPDRRRQLMHDEILLMRPLAGFRLTEDGVDLSVAARTLCIMARLTSGIGQKRESKSYIRINWI
jgi:hypothetical protein